MRKEKMFQKVIQLSPFSHKIWTFEWNEQQRYQEVKPLQPKIFRETWYLRKHKMAAN